MTNPLNPKHLVRGLAGGAALLLLAGCGGNPKPEVPPAPPPVAPLPTAGIAGQQVAVLPLTMIAADEALAWDSLLANRRAILDRADSVLGSLLTARSPEVNWVLPPALRREARRSPSVAINPDQMGTAFLRDERVVDVPDPLRNELRMMVALSGGRFVLAPAALLYRPAVTTVAGPPRGKAEAELVLVMVDARLGKVGWRTVARGEADDPWTALTRAVKALTPGLP